MKKIDGALCAILGCAFALRVWGIGFGLPDLYHADEPIVVNHAVAYGTGDFHPHFFQIPPLVSYLLFFTYGIYFFVGRTLGWFEGLHDFQIFFLTHPTSFYLLGRLVFGAILGTLTILVLYRMLAEIFSEEHALLSSFFLAVAFLHVRDSHYIYADILLLFLLVLCFFYLFRILEEGRVRDYLIFGSLAGMAVAAKYNGVFVFVPFLLAHFLRQGISSRTLWDGKFFLAGVASLGFYFCLNPFSLLDWKFFVKELLMQEKAEGYVGLFHHLTYSLRGGLGFPLWATALLGLGLSLIRPERKRMILISFLLFYYCPVLVFLSQPYDRYVLPLIPFAIFFAADLLIRVSQRFGFSRSFLFFLAFLVAFPSLAKAIRSDQIFLQKDARTLAREWVEATIPSGSKIALDIPFFMPRLRPTIPQLEEKRGEAGGGGEARTKKIELLLEIAREKPEEKRYELYFLKDLDGKDSFMMTRPSIPYEIETLKNKGMEYVIWVRVHPDHHPEFYRTLQEEGQLIARFTPYKDPSRAWSIDREPLTGGPFLWEELAARERNGQIIEVYALKPAARRSHAPP